MKQNRKKIKNQKGQTLIEFIMVMSMILTLVFMFVQLSYAIAWGHYVQYATFMSARALLSSGLTKDDQQTAAKSVLEKMVKASDGSDRDLLHFVSRARMGEKRDIQGAEPVPGAFIGAHPMAQNRGVDSRAFGWAEGVQYNFEVPLFLLPLVSWIAKSKGKAINMASGEFDAPPVEWNGKLPFTSDSWLGREGTYDECEKDMQELSRDRGIDRADGNDFLYDNGC